MKRAKEVWIGAQCEEIEMYLKKPNSKRAYQLAKVVVVLLFYVHGKHGRSCRDGQLT